MPDFFHEVGRCKLPKQQRYEALGIKTHVGGQHISGNPYSTCTVLESPHLYGEVIQDLLSGRVQAVHVLGYVPEEVRKALLSCLTEAERIEYDNDVIDPDSGEVTKVPYGVWRVGPALNTIFSTRNPKERSDRLCDYYSESYNARYLIEQALDGYKSPVEHFRHDMAYEAGLCLRTPKIEYLRVMSGIIRGTETGVTPMVTHPHIDVLRDETYFRVDRQFSAVFFLEVLERGGEFRIWNSRSRTPDDGEPEHEFIERAVKENGSVTVKPRNKSLLLFGTGYPHGTTPFSEQDGRRNAMQAFWGKNNAEEGYMWN